MPKNARFCQKLPLVVVAHNLDYGRGLDAFQIGYKHSFTSKMVKKCQNVVRMAKNAKQHQILPKITFGCGGT